MFSYFNNVILNVYILYQKILKIASKYKTYCHRKLNNKYSTHDHQKCIIVLKNSKKAIF